MRPTPLLRALSVAAYCFVAQVFLQSGAIVLLTALALIIYFELSGLVLAPIALFYLWVGLTALRRAGQALSGYPPAL